MKTNIEEYLSKHQLDVEQPEEDIIWEGIRPNIQHKTTEPRFQFWKVAAILLALITFSYIIYNELGREKEIAFTLTQINELLGERESEYQRIVLDKMKAAKINGKATYSDNQIISELVNELGELDQIYDETMNDLAQHGYLEPIVDIIFDTYEKRIRVLEQIIRETQKIETYENDKERIRL